jgi:Alginate export
MKDRFLKMFFAVSIVLLFASAAYAEITTSGGLYFRLRQETWDNMFDMNRVDVPSATPYARQDETFWRLKTSVWGKMDFDKQYGLYGKITNEAKYYQTSNTAWQVGTVGDEILADNLYAYAKKPAGLPVDLTIGRQDLLGAFGEMFLIAEGTPLDGSRTFYFNGVRALVTFNEKYNLDVAYLYTQEQDGFPTISYYKTSQYPDGMRPLNSYDEQAFVLYGRGKLADNVLIEPYYIWKNENTPSANARVVNPALPLTTLRLNTYGVHAVVGFGEGWKVRAEYALQSGSYDNGNDRTGNGGYLYIGRSYDNVAMKPAWDLGYITLSGDDPSTTNKVEAWDPLFSRYPWTSELYSLTMLTEKGPGALIPAYWTNLEMYRAMVKLDVAQDTRLDLSYNILKANETVSGIGAFAPMFSGSSKDRGTLLIAKLYRKFSPILDGYVTVECFLPGDVYSKTNQDAAQFVRWELQWKI